MPKELLLSCLGNGLVSGWNKPGIFLLTHVTLVKLGNLSDPFSRAHSSDI